MDITYYDIGLNLFTRSFPDPEKIIADAEADGICCILTGSEDRENRLVDDFVPNLISIWYGLAFILMWPMPRRRLILRKSGASSRPIRKSSLSVKPVSTMTACILKKKIKSTSLKN